ncbi:hypothetical protein BGZ49_003647 [Haplosporangium sp. Z 27]|nr:hypothetical protein BGZ49_003647 [Haplosporangium sp. Z 27]
MKYSVKPVLGVMGPGETVKVFVRSDSWINPQDRFLLQTIALEEDEGKSLDPRSWKALDSKRFIESYIPCSSTSALSIRDPDDDAGATSSSSTTSSTASIIANTPPFNSHDFNRLGNQQQQRSPNRQQQIFERWQYSETTRPTISMGGLGRRRSSSSSTCSSVHSSPGTYPTLFTPTSKNFDQLPSPMSTAPTTPTTPTVYSSKRNSFNNNFQGSIITSTIKEEPSGTGDPNPSESAQYLLSALGFSEKQVLSTTSKFKSFRQYNKKQVLLLSLICLIFGLMVSYDRVLRLLGVGVGVDVVGGHKDWISKDGSEGFTVQENIDARAVDLKESSQTTNYHETGIMVELNDINLQNSRQSNVMEGAV